MIQDPQQKRYRLSPEEMAVRLGLIVEPDEFLTVTRRSQPDGAGGFRAEFIVSIYPRGGLYPAPGIRNQGRIT